MNDAVDNATANLSSMSLTAGSTNQLQVESMPRGSTASAPRVVGDWSDSLSRELENTFKGVDVVSLDSEGVDLSRVGSISIVQLGCPAGTCWLFDVLDKPKNHPLVTWLQELLESQDIIKVSSSWVILVRRRPGVMTLYFERLVKS